ncbi:hypothetical protein MKX01_031078 [Papaver californicum]|nr:hypothetical protein MKX01_031078 [Papaver californicum]
MEGENVKIIFLMVIMGMFVGKSFESDEKSSSAEKACYLGCMIQCAMIPDPTQPLLACALTCLKSCYKNESPSSNLYCEFGCAEIECFTKSTPQDPLGEEVERCVKSYCVDKCKH